jgi:ABC-type Na+ efflux pump permease subunit
MQEEGNPASDAERPSSGGAPVITLFGKRMQMTPEAEGRARREDYEGYDSTGERRVFWLVTILFLGVLAAVAAGIYYLAAPGSRRAATAGRSLAREAAAAKRAASGGAQQAATQAKPASEPAAAQAPPSAKAAPAAVPSAPAPPRPQRAGTAGSPRRAATPKKAAATARRGRATVKQAARSRSLARAAAAADKTASPQKEYLRRLREQREQYERDKARGKYQEFPR